MTAAIVAAILLLTAGAVVVTRTMTAPANGAVDMKGQLVQLDPGDLPTARVESRMHIVSNTGDRFSVPSVGLDVPLGSLDVVDDQITPPGFTEAYLVGNLGVRPAQAAHGTVFVVMHSLRDGAVGPGNYLIDVASGTARVHRGAHIRVGDDTYTVTGWQALAKTAVPSDRSVWANVPGRLVVITCLQVPAQTASVDNMVITAALDR